MTTLTYENLCNDLARDIDVEMSEKALERIRKAHPGLAFRRAERLIFIASMIIGNVRSTDVVDGEWLNELATDIVRTLREVQIARAAYVEAQTKHE